MLSTVNLHTPYHALLRFEFLEVVVRLATAKHAEHPAVAERGGGVGAMVELLLVGRCRLISG